MKSDHENMYPFVAIDGSDYATEEEMKDANERIRAAQNFEAATLEKKIQGRIERGNRLIYSQNKDKWEKVVRDETTIVNIRNGSIDSIDVALGIMEMLDSGASIPDVYKCFMDTVKTNTTLKWDSLAHIFNFSKRGVEFCSGTDLYDDTPENRARYLAKEAENQAYASDSEYGDGERTSSL